MRNAMVESNPYQPSMELSEALTFLIRTPNSENVSLHGLVSPLFR